MAKNQELFEDVQIGFRNFSGAESQFNRAGDRNYVIFLEENRARQLEAEGWNVKWPKDRDFGPDEEDHRNPYLPVDANFNNYPPKIVMLINDNPTLLDESNIDVLDWSEIERVDAVIRPYHWEVNGKSGVKAYTKSLYVTIKSDIFQERYGI